MVPLPEDCALNTIDTGVVSPAVTTTSLALPTATVSPPLSLPSTLMSHVPTSRSIVGFESVVTTGALPTGPLKLMRYEATVTVGRIVLAPPPAPKLQLHPTRRIPEWVAAPKGKNDNKAEEH